MAARQRTSSVGVREVVGLPVLPSGRTAARAGRGRALVGRVHAAMAPPPVRILEGLFGLLDHRVLVALCDLGVPDVLTGPVTVTDLAARVGADPARLEPLLRHAATRGWVRIDRRARVRPTRVTAFLRADHPGGWRAWVAFAGSDEVVGAVGALTATLTPPDPFAAANGAPFFAWMARHPDRWAVFDQAMACGGRLHALALAAALDWSATRRVCDVGGGTGALLATLLDLEPDLHGVLLDLPEVVGRAVSHPRLEAIGGDAFVGVPGGCDTYLLVNVLHDWDDEQAIRILTRVREAGTRAARIVVVEGDRPTVPRAEIATPTDVLMAALTAGGRERDAVAFATLGRAAGLRHHRALPLASGDLAHILYPVATDLPGSTDPPAATGLPADR